MYKEQIEAYFADKEPLLIDAVSRLVAIGADRRKFGEEMERLWEHHCVDLCTIREA